MKRTILLLTLLATIFVSVSGVAWAIINGTQDPDTSPKYPSVGVLYDPDPYYAYVDGLTCTGTLISPKYFLTAAHCRTADTDQVVGVSFKSPASSIDANNNRGTFIAAANTDIAVVELNNTQNITVTAKLPTQGQFSSLKPKIQRFTAVGYGDTCKSGCFTPYRNYTPANNPLTLQSVKANTMQLFQKDGSGACFGDSGGPNFLGAGSTETSFIAGVTSAGDAACKNTNVITRLDTQAALCFLEGYSTRKKGSGGINMPQPANCPPK